MQNLVVFVPGIMGSRLKESSVIGGNVLWQENMYKTISHLARYPGLYKWKGNPLEPDGVLDKVKVPFRTYEICKLLREEMLRLESVSEFEYSEFSYDWRQDIFDAAKQFGDWLKKKHGFLIDDQGKQKEDDEPRLNIVAHSMGGLVSAIAISEGYINPKNIRRLICVGTPFWGAPATFKGLYSLGHLPGMEWFAWAINLRKNWITCRKNLIETFQSFISAYQLFPHQKDAFVQIPTIGKTNPIQGTVITPQYKNAAAAVHSRLLAFEAILQNHSHLKNHYHFIFSEHPSNTHSEYKARISKSNTTYERVHKIADTAGDGTVPVDSSAMGKPADSSRVRVVGVSHMKMCNDSQVVKLVKQFLS